MAEQKPGTERLEDLLGHNPSKELVGGDILAEAMKEIREERVKEAKVKAKELLTKAIDLHQAITKADQEWRCKVNKFNKELGKVLGRLDAFAQGNGGQCCKEEKQEECCQEASGEPCCQQDN
jgi:hypothetical protein